MQECSLGPRSAKTSLVLSQILPSSSKVQPRKLLGEINMKLKDIIKATYLSRTSLTIGYTESPNQFRDKLTPGAYDEEGRRSLLVNALRSLGLRQGAKCRDPHFLRGIGSRAYQGYPTLELSVRFIKHCAICL